ncbi:ArsR family transcriptional regulator [Chloroflexi bacterium CFX3]|nr:ArsR family transcriptional regulator [Chloroflexi bacterium CFX3]
MNTINARRERAAGWFWAENAIIDEWLRRLDKMTFAVYMTLCRIADGNTHEVHYSLNRIAEITGCSRSTVIRHLRVLQEKGLIRVERARKADGNNAVNTYILCALPMEGSVTGDTTLVSPVTPPSVTGDTTLVSPVTPDQDSLDQDSLIKTPGDRAPQQAEAAPLPIPSKKPKQVQPSPEIKDALAILCYGSAKNILPATWSRLVKLWNDLKQPSIDDLRHFYAWWRKEDWRGVKGERPNPNVIVQVWDTARHWNAPHVAPDAQVQGEYVWSPALTEHETKLLADYPELANYPRSLWTVKRLKEIEAIRQISKAKDGG